MRRDPEFVARLVEKSEELRQLLIANLLLDPEIAAPGIAAAKAIVSEFHSYGIAVSWQAALSPSTLEFDVLIMLWEPKDDQSEEAKRLYDEWFSKANNLPPPA